MYFNSGRRYLNPSNETIAKVCIIASSTNKQAEQNTGFYKNVA